MRSRVVHSWAMPAIRASQPRSHRGQKFSGKTTHFAGIYEGDAALWRPPVHRIFSAASPVFHRPWRRLSLAWPLVMESVLQPIDSGPVVTIGGLEIRPT